MIVPGLEGREGGGVGVTTGLGAVGGGAGEVVSFVEVMVETVILGALFWAGLSEGTVTEEVTTGGAGAVFTIATTGEAPPAVESRLTGAEQLLYGPCPALFTQVTRNLKVPPGGSSVTL